VRTLSPGWRRVAAVPAAIAVAVGVGIVVWGVVRLAREERAHGPRLEAAIAAAGGREALVHCGRVSTTPFERQHIAYALRLRSRDVWTHAVTPGVALIRDHRHLNGAAPLPVAVSVPGWVVRRSCP
jgi:hypothetical protein